MDLSRELLIEGNSLIITLTKNINDENNRFKRINVRKIVSLKEVTEKNFDNVIIELDTTDNLNKLYETLKEEGNSKIKISITNAEKDYLFELKNKRKFDYDTLKFLNKSSYIKKIRV